MQFYLLNKEVVNFVSSSEQPLITPLLYKNMITKYSKVSARVSPLFSNDNNKKKCSLMETQLKNYNDARHQQQPSSDSWNVELWIGCSEKKGYVQIGSTSPGNCLEALAVVRANQASIDVGISLIDTAGNIYPDCTKPGNSAQIAKEIFCWEQLLTYSYGESVIWNTSDSILAYVTVVVTLPEGGLAGKIPLWKADTKKFTEIEVGVSKGQRILNRDDLSDITIVAKNGVHVKAHKIFLAAESPLLLQEISADGLIEMKEMHKRSVRILLKYMYYNYTSFTKTALSIYVYEILIASTKYKIGRLKNLASTFLKKPTDWFDVDVAVCLFLYARQVGINDEQLKHKAVSILKSNQAKLRESKKYKELFETDPEAARELCDCSFAV